MAEKLDIEILQGDDFEWEITVLGDDNLPMDLTGCTARGMGRIKYKDIDPSFTFTCTVDPDQVTKKGLLNVSLSATLSEAVLAKTYVYDVELITSTAKVKKLYRGNAVVPAEATK